MANQGSQKRESSWRKRDLALQEPQPLQQDDDGVKSTCQCLCRLIVLEHDAQHDGHAKESVHDQVQKVPRVQVAVGAFTDASPAAGVVDSQDEREEGFELDQQKGDAPRPVENLEAHDVVGQRPLDLRGRALPQQNAREEANVA
eukprot:828296-Pleurochrysis_carterae.AAC.3